MTRCGSSCTSGRLAASTTDQIGEGDPGRPVEVLCGQAGRASADHVQFEVVAEEDVVEVEDDCLYAGTTEVRLSSRWFA
jgi:hypothetical protein